ncbi:RNA polymerase sigma factor SigM [Parenemella sanctibonifatiensis]|uniref:RNA polymerase sigma factor SigM n=1 Tax=Parenemella sanctibonifatiensis TaxID=2016505 RepID=A0A255DXC9_9ACTN|nr:RNA polymerase sigma factor SigM [Parenemella sanctibonifatiensis]OYN83989.1 RNA polymerase sigma factor SigM [Parenemella sanctibonifatiensis]
MTPDVTEPDRTDDPRDDKTLLFDHVAGDERAFGILAARHQQRMWNVALRTTRNPEDASDALQEAMISAFRRASTFRGDAMVTTWLHRIVVNACLDRLRRNKVRRSEPLPENEDRSLRLAIEDHSEDHLEQRELRSVIADALDQINPDQRAAIVLIDMEGYSVEEAAEMLGCAPGTIKSRCSRGRARLQPLLAPLRD